MRMGREKHRESSADSGTALLAQASASGGSRLAFLRPRSLRAQLALWHGGLLALTLILLSGFTYLLLRQVLNSRADAALADYADKTSREIAAVLYHHQTIHPGQDLQEAELRAFLENTEMQSRGRFVQVVDRNGKPVAVSDALRAFPLPSPPDTRLRILSGQDRIRFETIPEPRFVDSVRVVTVPVQMGPQIPYLVQVGTSVEGVEEAIQRVSTLLLVLTPSIFVIALLGGWMLVGRSLKPVDDMTRAALSIESKRLDVRLVPQRTDNEIGRLAGALNEMIARLDRSFRQIERFTADASHELKTPLTTIRGEAEVALMSDLTPVQYRATFQSIIEETERLSEIVNNLLLLSRADADQARLKQEPVALHEVAMQVYERLEGLAHRKNITLDIAAMEEVDLRGDALWLQQLMTNLLHNAIHYTPEGGKVVLSLTREDTEEVEGVPAFRRSGAPDTGLSPIENRKSKIENPRAVFAVRDTGPGIPAEHLPHIFDRFYRVDSGRSRDQGGSGLGLNIARWVTEAHGGQISVISEVGQGATFIVRLPIPDPDALS
jgi:two-component system OmpR family sensor kinase